MFCKSANNILKREKGKGSYILLKERIKKKGIRRRPWKDFERREMHH